MLAEVETDKATMELESFFDGTLLKIFAAPGSQVAIGSPLCAIGQPGEKVDVPAAPPAAPAPPPPGNADTARPAATGASPASANEVKPQPVAPPPAPHREAPPAPAAPPAAEPAAGRLRISPLARKLAAAKGIDPAFVAGSGPGGRIVRTDILAFEKSGVVRPAAGAPAAPAFTGAAPSRTGPIQEERVVPVSNMRGTIARRLVEAKTQLPHFYAEIEIDAAPLLALREQLNGALEREGVKLSVNDFVLKGSAEALRRVPQVNASWEGTQIRYFGAAHVAFAVAIEDGLITPVIRDAQAKSLFAISAEAKALGRRAKDRKLKPEEFTGGTFCVSNLGMMGITRFSAIINPPNAAILAVGTTIVKPVVKQGQIVPGTTMTLTLSCDHRVVDGALGAQYLAALKEILEAPAILLV